MLTIADLQNVEFPFRLITKDYSLIVTEFTSVEERDCSYNPKNKSLFLTNCRYISNDNSTTYITNPHDWEIGRLKDLSIVKHDDIEFQSFFNRIDICELNRLQSFSELSDIVKKRLLPKPPYVILSGDGGSYDFRKYISNKEYVHCEDDSMFIVNNYGFKGAANFKLQDSNLFEDSFCNFIINAHDEYFPFNVFYQLINWKGYADIDPSLTFHINKHGDYYNRIEVAGLPYIVEKIQHGDDLYVIGHTGSNRQCYFKLFNVEENQDFFITEFKGIHNQLDENIITYLDKGFVKSIFRVAHEHTYLAIPNEKLYMIYERKDEFAKKELPFVYYSENNGNYIVFRKSDCGNYNVFNYKNAMYDVLSASTIDKMFENNETNKNSLILNTSDLTRHHYYRISAFDDIAEMKNRKKDSWNSTGIDLDKALSNTTELIREHVSPKIENIDGSKVITGTKQSEGKLNYELDFGFITQMAERMAQNKGKYEPYNWKKPIDVEGLKQALFRHVMAFVTDNTTFDDGREYGHLESIALNVMMINYQLKHNKQNDKI